MKKLTDSCFCLVFILMLLTPFLFTNFKHDQISEINNSYLPELQWTESTPVGDRINDLENYLNMRIGFREQFLDLFQILNDRLFGIMEHPLYMYGKNEYVYFKNWGYIVDYQHLNLDQEYADELARSVQTFKDLITERGASFYYLIIPDKKTVYSEYMPKGMNQLGTVSKADQVMQSLRETDVNYLFLRDDLIEAKQHAQIFNVKYDAGHWNDIGAFYGISALYRRIRTDYPEIPMLTAEAYEIGTRHVDTLPVSHFAIDEELPVYKLKTSTAISDSDWMEEEFSFPASTPYWTRFVNPEKADLPKLLVFHDSYFFGRELFFTENFSEVTFIHRENLTGTAILKEYLDVLDPDIVVYEHPESGFWTKVFDLSDAGEQQADANQ